MTNVQEYIKNIGKSVVYATADVVKSYNPVIADTVETNQELFKAVAYIVRDHKIIARKTHRYIKNSKLYEAADQMRKSIIEDITTGKLYNPERKAKIEQKAMGLDSWNEDMDISVDFDSDDDMSFDDDDMSMDEDYLIDNIDASSKANAEMISSTVARTSEYIVGNQRQLHEHNMLINMRAFKDINGYLDASNQNISKLVEFNNKGMSTFIDNSKTYYETTTKVLAEMNALLKESVEMQRNQYKNSQGEDTSSSKRIDYDDIVTASGAINFSEYFKNVQKNMKNESGVLGAMGDMFEGGNTLMALTAAPLEFLPRMLVTKMIGENFKKSSDKLNKSISGFFSSALSFFNDLKQEDNFLSRIGNIFGVNNRLSTSIDTSKYNKGAVAWDGVAKKALTEVIPGLLSKILAVQSGKNEIVYDYESGKFMDITDVKKMKQDKIKSAAESGAGDVRREMTDMLEKFTFSSIEQQKRMEEDMQKFFQYFLTSGRRFDPRRDSSDYDLDINSDNYDKIVRMFKGTKRESQMNFDRGMMEARTRLNKDFEAENLKGTSLFAFLENNFKGGEIVDEKGRVKKGAINRSTDNSFLETKDGYGNNIFFYLNKITATLLEGIKVYNVGGAGDYNPGSQGIVDGRGRLIGSTNNPILDRNTNLNNYIYQQDPEDSRRESDARSFEYNKNRKKEKYNIVEELDQMSPEDFGYALYTKMDTESRIEKAKAESEKKEKRSWGGKFLETMVGTSLMEKFDNVTKAMTDITNKPWDFMANMMDNVDLRLYEIMYGKEQVKMYKGEHVRGFMDMLAVDMKQTFSNLNEWLEETIFKPMQENIFPKFEEFGDMLLRLTGSDMTVKDMQKGVGKFFFGDKDENGDYVSTSVFSDIFHQTKSDLFDMKNDIIGAPTQIAKITKLAEQYMYDPTKRNEVDQSIVLDKMLQALVKFHPRSSKETSLAKNIKSIIDDVDPRDPHKAIVAVLQEIVRNGYAKNDTLMAVIKEKATGAMNYTFGNQDVFAKIQKTLLSSKLDANQELTDTKGIDKDKFTVLSGVVYKHLHGIDKGMNISTAKKLTAITEILNELKGIDANNQDEAALKTALFSCFNGMKEEAQVNKALVKFINLLSKNIHVASATLLAPIASKLNMKSANVATGADMPIDLSSISPALINPADNLMTTGLGLNTINREGIDKTNVEDTVRPKSVFNTEGNTPLENLMQYFKDLPEHADGASFIPRDNYLASLHKGEAVVTADANALIPQMFEKISAIADSMAPSIKDKKRLSKTEYNEKLLALIEAEVLKSVPKTEKDGEDKEKILSIIKDYSDTQQALNDIAEISGKNISKGKKDTPSLATQVGEEMHSMTGSIKRALFGTTKEEEVDKKVNEDLEEVVKDAKKNFKEYLPHLGSGAIIGGGVGALAGLVGGPLAWAGIGAGAAFLKKSESAQKFLFGDKDLEGNRKGGLVGKGIQDLYAKYMPGTKKAAITGAILGTLTPLGLVGGVMGGVVYNFAKKNEVVQDFLFGEETGILGPNVKKFLDGLMPRTVAGGLTGALALSGPFGLVGGITVGAAIGMATKSQRFTEMLIGKEDKDGKLHGGLIGFMREKALDLNFFVVENMLKPVAHAIKPLAKEIGHFGKMIVKGVTDKIGEVFNALFGDKFAKGMDKIFGAVKNVIGGLGSHVLKGMGQLLTSPFRMLTHLDHQFRYNQMLRATIAGKKTGYSKEEEEATYAYLNENQAGGFTGAIKKGYKSRKMAEAEKAQQNAKAKEEPKTTEQAIEKGTKSNEKMTEKTHGLLERILYAIKGESHPEDGAKEAAKSATEKVIDKGKDAVTPNIPNDLEAKAPETASMLTPYGELKFKRDYKGTLKPLNSEVQNRLESEENRDNSFQDKLLEVVGHKPKEKKEGEEKEGGIFDMLKNLGGPLVQFGGAMLKMAPALLVALPLLPGLFNGLSKLVSMMGGGDADGSLEGDSIAEGGTEFLMRSTSDQNRTAFNFLAHSKGIIGGVGRTLMKPFVNLGNKAITGYGGAVKNMIGGNPLSGHVDDLATKGFSLFEKAFAIFKNPKIVKIIGAEFAERMAGLPKVLAEKVGKDVLGYAGKKLAGWLGPVGIAITAGDIIWGMSNADEVLQVEGDVPLPVRIVSGLVNALNQRFLFGLVPKKYLLSSVIKIMPEKIEDDISEGQQALKATYEKYKKEAKGEAVSFDDYSKKSEKYNKEYGVEATTSKFKWYNPFTWGKGNSEPQYGMGSGPKYGMGLVSKIFGGKSAEEKAKAKNARYTGAKDIKPTGRDAQRTTFETSGKVNLNKEAQQNTMAARAVAGGRTKDALMESIDPPAIPFFSQKDRRWANDRFNSKNDTVKQTIGDSGCGPTAASMVVSAFKGTEVYPNEAAKFAVDRGFKEKNGGTKPGFFPAFATEHGVSSSTQKLDGKATKSSIGGSIMDKIRQGIPTILMGKGGASTPFGKKPHYVVAVGTDGEDKVIIHDPERNKGNYKFNFANTIKASTYAITSNAYQSLGIPDPNSPIDEATGEEGVTDEQAIESQNLSPIEQIMRAGEIMIRGLMGLDYSDLMPGADGGTGGATGSGASGLSTSKKDFIKRLIKVAMEGFRSKRVLPSVHIAQAIHESAWGASGLAQKGKNLFGFKCGSSWKGESINMKTGEVYNGKSTTISANFRKYKTWEDSQRDYVDRMSSMDRYKGVAGAKDYKTAVALIVKGGYATDPAYASKVIGTIEKYNLQLLDKGNEKEFLASLESDLGGSAMADGSVRPVLAKMESVKGKLAYSMTGARNPEKGSADCSSTVRWAYEKGAGINVGHSTLDQINKGTTVDKGKVAGGKSSLSNLRPGDLLFFQRSHGKNRKYGVGHVEMYYGNGKMIGHGGGAGGKVKGPTIKTFNPNDSKYILAKRHIRPSESTGTSSGAISKSQAMMGMGSGPSNVDKIKAADADFVKRIAAYAKQGLYDKRVLTEDEKFAMMVNGNTEMGDYANQPKSTFVSDPKAGWGVKTPDQIFAEQVTNGNKSTPTVTVSAAEQRRIEVYKKYGLIGNTKVMSPDERFAREVQAKAELGDYGNMSNSSVTNIKSRLATASNKFENTDIFQKLKGRIPTATTSINNATANAPTNNTSTVTSQGTNNVTVANDPAVNQSLQILIALITKMLEHTGNLSQVVELLSKGLNINIPKEKMKSLKNSNDQSAAIANAIRNATAGKSGSLANESLGKLIMNMNEIIAQPQ